MRCSLYNIPVLLNFKCSLLTLTELWKTFFFLFKGLIDIHWAEIFRRLPEIKWVIHFLDGSASWSLIVILIMHDNIVWVC